MHIQLGSGLVHQNGGRGSLVIAPTLALTILVLASTWTTAGDWDNDEWTSTVVDSFGGLSSNTGLSTGVDSQGRIHVAYFSLKGADLKYALLDGGSWSTETVDNFQTVGPDCSIALDENDHPHICYYDKTNEELEYARRNGTTWDIETVDSLGIVGVGSSIAIGPDGAPHMVYVGARTLRSAHRTPEGWNVTVIDDVEGHVYTPSITFDGDGVPHVLYLGSGTVKHAYRTDGKWTMEMVDDLRVATIPMRTTILVDPSGDLVACYANDAATSVIIARREEGTWTKERVATGHYLSDMDMELDIHGEPHVALIDMGFNRDQELVNTDIWYIERKDDSWTEGVVLGSSGNGGMLLDLQMYDGEDPGLLVMDVDPIMVEADLTHFTGWSGTFIEPYSGEDPDGNDGNGGDDKDGDGDSDGALGSTGITFGLLAIALTVVALYTLSVAVKRD